MLFVNAGELLRMATNDKWLSTRHYALIPRLVGEAEEEASVIPNTSAEATTIPRDSIAFFYVATADYRLEVVPTCYSNDDPSKYKATSYFESQAIAQQE